MTRIIRNRLAFGKRYRLQFGRWVPVRRFTDASPAKRFIVEREEDHATRAAAEASRDAQLAGTGNSESPDAPQGTDAKE